MSSTVKRSGLTGCLVLALAALALPMAGISAAQAAPSKGLTAAAQMARHFNHEDAIYARQGARSLPFLGAGSIGNGAGPSRGDAIRGAALNRRYSNSWTRVSPTEFRTLVSAFGAEVTATMTPQQARAELARGQGLNRLAEQYAAAAQPIPTGSGDGFDWSVAGIGVGAGFGALFLVAAGALVLRRRGRPVLHS